MAEYHLSSESSRLLFEFLIVGDGPLRDYLEVLADRILASGENLLGNVHVERYPSDFLMALSQRTCENFFALLGCFD